MIMAATEELVRLVPTQKDKKASLLPPLSDARQLGRSIAKAVGRQAIQDGQAQVAGEHESGTRTAANIWDPVYVPYERKRGSRKSARFPFGSRSRFKLHPRPVQ